MSRLGFISYCDKINTKFNNGNDNNNEIKHFDNGSINFCNGNKMEICRLSECIC